MRIGASVDLGSNSVHLLVAAVEQHRLEPVVDESVFLGLGTAVAERGFLGGAARAELVAALARYAAVARGRGAADVTFIGTEPLRRAADAPTIVHEAGLAADAPLHVVSHEEEAYLTIIGVMEGLPVTQETLVVDIGGGSSEFCIVDATHRPRAAGLRLGSARLTDRFVASDPPRQAEVEAMRSVALDVVRGAPASRPRDVVAVGGTASNLLKVLPDGRLHRTLSRELLREAVAVLQAQPVAETSARHGVNMIRARILPAGAVILDAILEHYGVDQLRVSDSGVREGTVLAVAHAGKAWRDRLADLAHGWRT
jgi:exopolyphosphatase/guanosine-5'-triphosphate,3'-diphosphate pyrophosphatase